MNKTKPKFEKISPQFGSSLHVKVHNEKIDNKLPFWHFHPELELVYINKAQGKRHIGSHLSYFNNSQLILIGANLPHSGFADRFTANGVETLVQFEEGFLGKDFFNIPEMNSIKILFDRAKKGILFGKETKNKLGEKIIRLNETSNIDRILSFLEILKKTVICKKYYMNYHFSHNKKKNNKHSINDK